MEENKSEVVDDEILTTAENCALAPIMTRSFFVNVSEYHDRVSLVRCTTPCKASKLVPRKRSQGT